jgi:hypothetical protein
MACSYESIDGLGVKLITHLPLVTRTSVEITLFLSFLEVPRFHFDNYNDDAILIFVEWRICIHVTFPQNINVILANTQLLIVYKVCDHGRNDTSFMKIIAVYELGGTGLF